MGTSRSEKWSFTLVSHGRETDKYGAKLALNEAKRRKK
jgi:hypothetical protein